MTTRDDPPTRPTLPEPDFELIEYGSRWLGVFVAAADDDQARERLEDHDAWHRENPERLCEHDPY